MWGWVVADAQEDPPRPTRRARRRARARRLPRRLLPRTQGRPVRSRALLPFIFRLETLSLTLAEQRANFRSALLDRPRAAGLIDKHLDMYVDPGPGVLPPSPKSLGASGP